MDTTEQTQTETQGQNQTPAPEIDPTVAAMNAWFDAQTVEPPVVDLPVEVEGEAGEASGAGGAGGAGAAGDVGELTEQQPVTETPASAPAPEPVPDPTANLISLGDGLVVNRDDLTALYRWADSLTPEQRSAVDRAIADGSAVSGGGFGLAPSPAVPGQHPQTGQYPQAQPSPYAFSPQAPGTPGAPVTPESLVAPTQPHPGPAPLSPEQALGGLAELAPDLVAYLRNLEASSAADRAALASYQQQAQQIAAQQAQRDQQERLAQLTRGADEFAAAHPDLTDVDHHYLRDQAVQLGILPGLVRRHNGDVAAAYRQALDAALWSTPKYRDLAIQGQFAAMNDTSQQIADRAAAAASLSSQAGSAPRSPRPTPAGQQTPQDIRAGMAQMIQQGQTP